MRFRIVLCLFCAVSLLSACSNKRPSADTPSAHDMDTATLGATMTEKSIAPFGTWASPISAADLAQSAVDLNDLRTHAGTAYWRESRPNERGRQVLMRRDSTGKVEQITPPDFNVRTRVHEYGGNAYVLLDDGVVFVNFSDQRLYWQAFSGASEFAAPIAITPAGYQFADGFYDRANARMLWVREDHREATKKANAEERNEIIALALPGSDGFESSAGNVLVTGADFYAYPRSSADGKQLAWIEWDHPNMPWDRTRLMHAQSERGVLGAKRAMIDRVRMAPLEPQFDQQHALFAVADPANWWNLVRVGGAGFDVLAAMPRELAGPLWQLGLSSYVLHPDGLAIVRSALGAKDALGVIELKSGNYLELALPFVAIREVQLLDQQHVLVLAQNEREPIALLRINIASGAFEELHRPSSQSIDAGTLAQPVAIEYPTTKAADGAARTAHAWFYAPTNANYRAPAGELPPLIAMVHGGPTSVSRATLNLSRQYWTSRGFAVVDVNYGGSTSFGRDYRERLNGGWGLVDVQDVIAAVDYLVHLGKVDPQRLAIRGGSAGGFTTLAALAFHDRFNAGTNLFGVSDIAQLAATSHKFERNYDQSLVGPPNADLYRERSPLFHLDRFDEPLLTLQGSEDKIVPPAQSRAIVDALDQRKVPHAYIEFDGEQHGFRQAPNIIRAQEAELYFYGQIFGFAPAGSIAPVTIKHWPPSK
jgi:dipeptidyl aminopeptidase/acylaminoacyl peptidase